MPLLDYFLLCLLLQLSDLYYLFFYLSLKILMDNKSYFKSLKILCDNQFNNK